MTKFEDRLRAELRDAAQGAPEFHGPARAEGPVGDGPAARETAATRGRRFGWTGPQLAAAAVAVAVAGVGVSWWALRGDGSSGGVTSASCAGDLHFGDRSYGTVGDQFRTLRKGTTLGTGVIPACDDTGQGSSPGERRRVYKIAGVNSRQAILDGDGNVWLNLKTTKTPTPLREVLLPVECTRSGTSTISGRMTGESVGKAGLPEGATRVQLPYTAWFVADKGSALPLKRYANVLIKLRVTKMTTGGRDVAVTRAAQNHGAPITATVRCEDHSFVATSLRLTARQ